MRDLELLGTFLEVYRAGSISSAATRLGMSQPSVSERIARLEQTRGETLLLRSARGVRPTAAGDRLAARIAQPIDQLRGASTRPAQATGRVRIGGASDVVSARIIPALASLSQRGIVLDFTLGLAADLLDRLVDGELDVVISSIRTASPAVRYRGLVDEEFVLIGAPPFAATIDRAKLAVDPAAALAHLPIVAYDEQLSIVRRYWRSQFGIRPANDVVLTVPDLRGVLAAVIASAGVSAVPRYLADAAIASGSVEILHRPDIAPINTLYLAIPVDGAPNPATAEVIARLMERAGSWDVF